MANIILNREFIECKLGQLVAISSDTRLYYLNFTDCKDLTPRLTGRFQNWAIQDGSSKLSEPLRRELDLYFRGELKEFSIPVELGGSNFQIRTWKELCKTPYGQKISYLALAKSIDHPTAFRAVAQANSLNPILLIIPCHRAINKNGKFGGYRGDVSRKTWLLNHELAHSSALGYCDD